MRLPIANRKHSPARNRARAARAAAGRPRRRFLFLPGLERFEDRTLLSAISWISATGGDWDTAANWSTGTVPGSGDDVTISQTGITVTLSGSDQAQSLTSDAAITINGTFSLGATSTVAGSLSVAGTLTGPVSLTVTGATALSDAAALTDVALDARGGLSIDTAGGAVSLHATAVTNRGAATWAGQYPVYLDQGSVISNLAGATFTLASDAVMSWDTPGAGAAPEFDNAGSVVKSAGASNASSVLNLPFVNSGSVSVQQGYLRVENYAAAPASTGTYSGAAGTTLELDDAALAAGASVSGDSVRLYAVTAPSGVPVSAATALGLYGGSYSGPVSPGASASLSLYDVALDPPSPVTAGSLSVAGTLTGPVSLTVTGATALSDAAALTDVALDARGGLSIDTAGGAVSLHATAVTNRGAATWAGQYPVYLDQGSVISNLAGATFTLASDAVMSWDTPGAGAAPEFDNAGTIIKSGGSGTTTLSVAFKNNGGAVNAQTGTIYLGRSQSITGGSFSASAGGSVDITGGNTVALSGTVTGSGAGVVSLNSGTLAVAAGGATLNFAGGVFQWSGGTIDTSKGVLTNAGTINVTGAGAEDLSGKRGLVDNGAVVQSGACNLRLDNGTKLTVGGKGSYDLQAGGIVSGSGAGGSVFNVGMLEKTQGTGTATISAPINTTGKVTVNSGTLSLTGAVSQVSGGTLAGGTWSAFGTSSVPATITVGSPIATIGSGAGVTLSGPNSSFADLASLATNSGTFSLLGGQSFATAGNFTNAGKMTLSPGSVLTVNGNFAQTAAGKLTVQIGGTSASPIVGTVAATGTVTLAGSLVVTSTVTPSVGTSLTLVNNQGGSAVSGIFTGMTEGTVITINGKHYKISYVGGPNHRSVVLTRTS